MLIRLRLCQQNEYWKLSKKLPQLHLSKKINMAEWSLEKVLEGLHDDIHQQLETARKALAHPGTKGDASEEIWLELFNKYLPKRYQAEKAHVVDSAGNFSQQMDVVIFDRQYS